MPRHGDGAQHAQHGPAPSPSILDLQPDLIAHIGSFCDHATQHAASRAHRCLAAIHRNSSEHTWHMLTDPIWHWPPSTTADCFWVLAKRLLSLLQRKPCLQKLTVQLPRLEECLHHQWYTSCLLSLALLSRHVEVQLLHATQAADGPWANYLSQAMQGAQKVLAAAAAEPHADVEARRHADSPTASLPPTTAADSPTASLPPTTAGGLAGSLAAPANPQQQQHASEADAWPPLARSEETANAGMQNLTLLVARLSRQVQALRRSTAMTPPAPCAPAWPGQVRQHDVRPAGSAGNTGSTANAGSVASTGSTSSAGSAGYAGNDTQRSASPASLLPLAPRPLHLRFGPLLCSGWQALPTLLTLLHGGLVSIQALTLTASPRLPEHMHLLQVLCGSPRLAESVGQLSVCVRRGDLWHTLGEEQLQALERVGRVNVTPHVVINAYAVSLVDQPAADWAALTSLPLVQRCATSVTADTLTHSSTPSMLSSLCRAARLQQVVVEAVLEFSAEDQCEVVRQLGSQLPAHVEVVLRGTVLLNPCVVDMALVLLTTPPPTLTAPTPAAGGGGCGGGGSGGGNASSPGNASINTGSGGSSGSGGGGSSGGGREAGTPGRVVRLSADPVPIDGHDTVYSLCASLAWHHIRARLLQQLPAVPAVSDSGGLSDSGRLPDSGRLSDSRVPGVGGDASGVLSRLVVHPASACSLTYRQAMQNLVQVNMERRRCWAREMPFGKGARLWVRILDNLAPTAEVTLYTLVATLCCRWALRLLRDASRQG